MVTLLVSLHLVWMAFVFGFFRHNWHRLHVMGVIMFVPAMTVAQIFKLGPADSTGQIFFLIEMATFMGYKVYVVRGYVQRFLQKRAAAQEMMSARDQKVPQAPAA